MGREVGRGDGGLAGDPALREFVRGVRDLEGGGRQVLSAITRRYSIASASARGERADKILEAVSDLL